MKCTPQKTITSASRLRRLLREAERIADEIRHVLNFRHLIIVREDDGVELFFERENFLRQRLELAFGHRRARMHFCDINHGEKLPPFAVSVNKGKFGDAIT